MMIESVLFCSGLALLALAGWLRRQRSRWTGAKEQPQRLQQPQQPQPHYWRPSFDTAAITPRLQHVRENYLVEITTRQRGSEFHDQLLEAARRAVRAMNFFKTS